MGQVAQCFITPGAFSPLGWKEEVTQGGSSGMEQPYVNVNMQE